VENKNKKLLNLLNFIIFWSLEVEKNCMGRYKKFFLLKLGLDKREMKYSGLPIIFVVVVLLVVIGPFV